MNSESEKNCSRLLWSVERIYVAVGHLPIIGSVGTFRRRGDDEQPDKKKEESFRFAPGHGHEQGRRVETGERRAGDAGGRALHELEKLDCSVIREGGRREQRFFLFFGMVLVGVSWVAP